MKKVLISLFFVGLFGLIVYIGYYLYKKSEKPKEVFETTTAFKTNIIKKTVATGSIVPRREVAIKPQVSGIIDKIFVEPGDVIKKGQLIARIKIIPNSENLNRAESSVKQNRIRTDEAKRELERQQLLYDKGVIAQQAFNSFLYEYNIAKEELASSISNLQIIKEGAAKNSGQVANLVTSTLDGMVLDVPVKEGANVIESNTFNEGTTIASVADMTNLIFEGKVDESEVGKLKVGMPIELKVGAIDEQSFNAVLEYISPKGMDENGTIQFQIKASVNLVDSVFLRAGFSANADIVLDKRDSVLAINEANLLFEDDKVFVEYQNGDKIFEKKEVTIGLSDGINAELLSGLDITDKIKIQN